MSTKHIADDTEVVPPGELCCIGEGPPPRGPQCMSTEYIADDTEVVPPATEGPPQAETPRLGDGDVGRSSLRGLPGAGMRGE